MSMARLRYFIVHGTTRLSTRFLEHIDVGWELAQHYPAEQLLLELAVTLLYLHT